MGENDLRLGVFLRDDIVKLGQFRLGFGRCLETLLVIAVHIVPERVQDLPDSIHEPFPDRNNRHRAPGNRCTSDRASTG